MSNSRNPFMISLQICLCTVILLTVSAVAQPIEDLLTVKPGDSSELEFGTPALPPLPADFFGPGSDPFAGQVSLGPTDSIEPASGDAAILLVRPYPPIWPHEPPGTIVADAVDVMDLRLRSIQPLDITYLGGSGNSESWNLEVTLSSVAAPPGSQTTSKTHDNGGTYHAIFNVQPNFRFIRNSDGAELLYDTGLAGIPALSLDVFDCPWVHEPDPMQGFAAPSAGFFVSCVIEPSPGEPFTQCPVPVVAAEPSGALTLELFPADLLPPPDPLCSVPGSEPNGTHVIFGPPGNPAIPPDFFGPGSDPFTGDIELEGEPLGETDWGDYGDADTLIRRHGDPFNRCDLPSPDSESVYFDFLAVNLVSIAPITVTYNGGQDPELWDLRMVSSPRNDQPGWIDGWLTVTKTHDNGGTFLAIFCFFPKFIITRQTDGQTVVLDTGPPNGAHLDYTAAAGQWTHTVVPDLNVMAPSNGQFVPGVMEVVPGDPMTQDPVTIINAEDSGAGHWVWRPKLVDISAAETVPLHREVSLTAYPNPFNPVTNLSFDLEVGGQVSLRIFDLSGRHVCTLIQGVQAAGRHDITWQARDERGRKVPSGVYLCVLQTPEGEAATKLAIIK